VTWQSYDISDTIYRNYIYTSHKNSRLDMAAAKHCVFYNLQSGERQLFTACVYLVPFVRYSLSNNDVRLKCGLTVKWSHLIDHVRLPINIVSKYTYSPRRNHGRVTASRQTEKTVDTRRWRVDWLWIHSAKGDVTRSSTTEKKDIRVVFCCRQPSSRKVD